MTQHFNGLTEAEQERLVILMEECAEVIQIGGKILRHGYASTNPTIPGSANNRELLERELGHVEHIKSRMEEADDLEYMHIINAQIDKAGNIERFLHHQPRIQASAPPDENPVDDILF